MACGDVFAFIFSLTDVLSGLVLSAQSAQVLNGYVKAHMKLLLALLHLCFFGYIAICAKISSLVARARWQWRLIVSREHSEQITKDIAQILKSGSKSIPRHLSLAVNHEQTQHVNQLARIIYWFASAGFPCISIFDTDGAVFGVFAFDQHI